MIEPDDLVRSRSREGYREFAWQLAVARLTVSVVYARMATLGGRLMLQELKTPAEMRGLSF